MKYLSALVGALLLSSGVAAQTYWLNIPGHKDKETGAYIPPTSLPTSSHDKCADAIVEYARQEYVYYIGCDVVPLPDAVNLKSVVVNGRKRWSYE